MLIHIFQIEKAVEPAGVVIHSMISQLTDTRTTDETHILSLCARNQGPGSVGVLLFLACAIELAQAYLGAPPALALSRSAAAIAPHYHSTLLARRRTSWNPRPAPSSWGLSHERECALLVCLAKKNKSAAATEGDEVEMDRKLRKQIGEEKYAELVRAGEERDKFEADFVPDGLDWPSGLLDFLFLLMLIAGHAPQRIACMYF